MNPAADSEPVHVDPRRTELTPAELAARSGVAVSALHFYEREGLLAARRTAGNQRRYPRSTLRRVAFVRASQRVGIPLARIREALDTLPTDRDPRARDWQRLTRAWRSDLDARIHELEQLRDDLAGCIGCGCLSLRRCTLVNPGDTLGDEGVGARRLLGATETGGSPAAGGRSGGMEDVGTTPTLDP